MKISNTIQKWKTLIIRIGWSESEEDEMNAEIEGSSRIFFGLHSKYARM